MVEHDVLIVGAGPVGLLLACLLARQGRDVVVCEQRTGTDGRSRAIGLHPPGLDALDAAGIGDVVRAEAVRLEGGEVRSRRRTLAQLAFTRERPVHILPQARTDALLRQRLRTLAPDALLPGHMVVAVHEHGERVLVRLDDASGMREVSAALVVVADGVHSRLRQEAGFGWRHRAGEAAYAMVDVDDDEIGARAVLHCEPEGLVESFPLPTGRRWVVREEGAPLDTREAFGIAVELRTGIRLALAGRQPTRFIAAQHLAATAVHGRIVLVGDAAHEVSPIGGQGMNLGWAAARRLADAIVAAPVARMPDLRSYAVAVRRAAVKAQRRSAFYMAMGEPASGAMLRGREAMIRVLGSAPLQGWTSGLITMRGL